MIRQLYCTAGAGMEELLAQEVQHKLCATQVEQIPGRVFFCSSADLQTVTRLKSAERLFVLLRRAEPVSLPNNPAKQAAVIKQGVVGDPDIWRQSFLTWKALQQELQCSQERGQKRKREDEEESLYTPSFRVSCRCSGVIARFYTSQRLSRIIGMAIKEDLGWKVDLRDPVLEVNVYLSNDHCIVGIPLLKHPLACRSYMKHNGLRSTIAWAVSSLCPKKLNDCVILDPMCGVGAVLLEAAQEYSNAVFLGMDTDLLQLQKAEENVKASGLEGRVQLLQSSAMEIPLADGAVDAVLCDIPFGRKFSCSSDMSTALPRLLREMERVLRVGGHLVLLLSLQLSAQLKKIICTPEHNQNVNSLDTNNLHTDPSKTHKESTDAPLMFDKASSEMSNTQFFIRSLQAHRTHRVSLGSTDALIHTYTKIHTPTKISSS
ncbi:THUMP domain-containing protein 2 [Puntigrus tetrazona]|uniref:THUMP domain-containing protein 2 n=1 Tax=Puntigrus tetrazona TaxID=1606681 RepID=UPI001C8927DA|nr:THUMP domain-containing protein 2 [Puntigrus tetrazona]